MPRRPVAKRKPVEHEPESDLEEDFLADDDFVEELRGAIARARSSGVGGRDLHDGPWGGGFDRLQVEFGDW